MLHKAKQTKTMNISNKRYSIDKTFDIQFTGLTYEYQRLTDALRFKIFSTYDMKRWELTHPIATRPKTINI